MIPGELGGEKVMIRMEAVEDVPWIIGKGVDGGIGMVFDVRNMEIR